MLSVFATQGGIQGYTQDFSKVGGEDHIVSNRGYSPDRHVDLYAMFYLMHVTKKGLQRGSSRPPQDPSLPSYTSGSLRSSLCLALRAEKIILDVNVKDMMDTVDDLKQGGTHLPVF